MSYKLLIILFLFSPMVMAQGLLDKVVLEHKIRATEEKLKLNTGTALNDIAQRTNLEHELLELKREKGRRLLSLAIQGTDTSSLNVAQQDFNHRYQRRIMDLGPQLNFVMDNTIEQANPAIAGKKLPEGRALVLYRDIDPGDVYLSKVGTKEVIVYKTQDLRGRTVYKDLNGKISEGIIQKSLFPKEEVVIMDESGKLLKGMPKAIYPDGTLEIKDSQGFTHRRRSGSYHLSDEIKSVSNGKIVMHSGNTEEKLSEKEKKALAALKKIMCDL